jgi:hypothetical protein
MIVNKNMELIKNINFEELDNDKKKENDIIDAFNKDNKDKNDSEYDNSFRNSLMYKFNQINNCYIDEENTKSYEQMNNYDYNQKVNNNNNKKIFRNNTVRIANNNNINNSITSNLMNNYENNNNIYYPTQHNNISNYPSLEHNNIYYPTQNLTNTINDNYNSFNTFENNTNNYSTQNNFTNSSNYSINNCNNNIQSLVPFQPAFNNNNNSQYQNINYDNANSKDFSQYDLSFLGGYAKTNDLKEDFLKINPSNPEIISELKEKIYYYFSLNNGCKLIKIALKGYIGINIKAPNIINNKVFYINILSEKWKDNNYFINRDINQKIEQITQMIYKIQLQKQQKPVKLMTYSMNQNITSRIKIIEPQININNNQLIYKFHFNKESYKFIQRIEIIVEYKTYFMRWNMIQSDGKIMNNNNTKINVVYNKSINEGKIVFPNNFNYNIFQYIKKISIMIQLKNAIISNMNIKINYSNSTNQPQESSFCKRASLLCFQYE